MILLFIILILILINVNKKKKTEDFKNPLPPTPKAIDIKKENNIDYSKYYTKNYIMTTTELNFYRSLKVITDKLELSIFPQVDLERIIKVYNNDFGYRNRIKSRSIDYTIVNNKNCKIVCCIELDDYYHNKKERIERDIFINNLFKNVGIKLIHIKVGYYNLEQIEKNIKEAL